MILLSLHFILLLSTLSTSIHGRQKRKRDISDLKNDNLLSKVFPGHLEEKKERKDRSINIQDEQETNKKTAVFSSNYYLQPTAASAIERRAVDPVQEAMSPYYSPASYYSNQVDQRNYIPHPDTPATQNQGVKKSDIPEAPPSSTQDSFPLHLRVKSPNSKLQGAVPHFEEYGETVESVLKAQKRFKIPRPEYSSVIVKKNDIPHPDDDFEDDVSEDAPSPTVAATLQLKERSKISHHKKQGSADRRQYVQYPQMQQFGYNNGYASNYMNGGNFMNAQQSGGAFQFQQPQQVSIASHVKNLDGAISRPIVSEKACDDQFSLCSEYAKNSYCTNYPEQMKVQCRKSCDFCISPDQQTTAGGEAKAKINDDDDDDSSGSSASGSGENEQNTKRTITQNAVRRHDILQERGKIQQVADGSGSGSGDGSGSGSGSGSSESASGPVETDKRSPNLQQEFHIPSKKDETEDSDEESGSGSGSGDESGDSETQKKTRVAEAKKVEAPKHVKHVKSKTHKKSKVPTKVPAVHHQNKRGKIPYTPSQALFYPRIDLKEIASSLAHYEEAALELAGEYPRLQDTDVTEYTRSFIPHPETSDDVRTNRNRQNIQIAKIISSERARKSNVPKFLKVTGDVKKPEKAETNADSLDSVQRRFSVPGVEPTLNDYYAETGKLNPFDKMTSKNYKKSRIESPFKYNYDPYEYLRNMPAGASMEPIIDPHKRASIPSDHSYPVFLMKVSPTDEKKYVEEKPDRRGKIRHYNAEGVEISAQKYQQVLRGGHPEMEDAVRKQNIMRSFPTPRPKLHNVNINLALKRTPARLRLSPTVPPAAPPPAAVAPQFQPFSQPSMYSQLQQSYEQQASMFPNTEQVPYEQQPGANSLRSKMLNAFFDMKSKSGPEEGSGSGDSGLGFRRNVI